LAALLVESYKKLQLDDNLSALQDILRAVSNGDDIPPRSEFKPTSSAVRVNLVWFSSLALTLGVAVQVMLAKQWLHKYGEGLSNVPRLRTQLRQYRYDSLRAWSLPETVNFLPTLLHLALALFLYGLIDFLWGINRLVAAGILTICVIFGTLYLVVMILPHIYSDCPYRTPFSRILGIAYYRIRLAIHNLRHDLVTPPTNIPIEQAEFQAIHARRDVLQAKALAWLMTQTRNPQIIKTVTQALASLTSNFEAVPILRQAGAIQRVAEQFLSCFTEQRIALESTPQFQLIPERSVEAGLYAKALVGLTEGLPASRWPQQPPRDLHLYADVLDAALSELAAQTDQAEVVAFAVTAREHIFRAGRNRYPNSRSQQPTHSLGALLHLTNQIADDEIIPGIAGVVCTIDTIRRCIEATIQEQRHATWKDFSVPLIRILVDTPPNCRVRLALSKCLACFAGLSYHRDFSEGHDPTEHRLLYALSALLVVDARNAATTPKTDDNPTEPSQPVADVLYDVVEDYSRSFVHSIRPLGDVLSRVVPVFFTCQSTAVQISILQIVQYADYVDLPEGFFSQLIYMLKEEKQAGLHPKLTAVLERHLHRPEVADLLGDAGLLRGIIQLLNSDNEDTQTQASRVLLEICSLGLRAGGKAAQRSALDPLLQSGLLHVLKDFFWKASAILATRPMYLFTSSREDAWIPRILAMLDLYTQEVKASEIMDACIVLCQQLQQQPGQAECTKNLTEWWDRYLEWSQTDGKDPKPRPRGPLYRRSEN
jgi:hypothetical protein